MSNESLSEVVLALLDLPYVHVENKSYVPLIEVIRRTNELKQLLKKADPELYKKTMLRS